MLRIIATLQDLNFDKYTLVQNFEGLDVCPNYISMIKGLQLVMQVVIWQISYVKKMKIQKHWLKLP